jgi:hypothetical protein
MSYPASIFFRGAHRVPSNMVDKYGRLGNNDEGLKSHLYAKMLRDNEVSYAIDK